MPPLKGGLLSQLLMCLPAADSGNFLAAAGYSSYTQGLEKTLPPAVRKELAALEAVGQGSGDRCNEIVFNELYPRHVCRVWPFPEPVQRAFNDANFKIYNHMQGTNEFEVTGNLKGWDRWKDLHRIDVATLPATKSLSWTILDLQIPVWQDRGPVSVPFQ